MKTIQQLLELSKNPFYKFTNDEREVLDDFLEKKREEASKTSPKRRLSESQKKTRAIVRNVVKKTVDTIEEE